MAELGGPKLDGPRIEPRSGKARQLVVFLHGYGADGNDLIEIGRAWAGLLPDAAFVSPHAPNRCGQAPVQRSPGSRDVKANHSRPAGAWPQRFGACGDTKAASGSRPAQARPISIRSLPSAP